MKIIDVPQSGKCGTTVAFSGRNGLVRRAWVVPSNPRTARQMNVRATLAQQIESFRALSEAEQDAWSAAASLYQSKARLGQSGPLTAVQFFTKVNATLALHGEANVTVPPVRPSFGDLAPSALVITNVADVVTLKLTCGSDPGENTFLRGAKPVSNAVRAVPGMIMLGTVPAPTLGSCNITSLYTAAYGVPGVGTRVFVGCYQMTNGFESLPTIFTGIVPAAS